MSATLKDLDILAEDHRNSRDALSDAMTKMTKEVEVIKAKHLPNIRALVIAGQDSASSLKAAIEDAPELFEKPRTRSLHGIKIGFSTSAGKVEFEDGDTVVKLIKKNLPDQASVLIKSKEAPVKAALKGLNQEQLEQIGAKIAGAGELVVLTPTDSELDKLVDALLTDEEEAA